MDRDQLLATAYMLCLPHRANISESELWANVQKCSNQRLMEIISGYKKKVNS